MSDDVIDTEWSSLAIEDDSIVLEYNEYDLIIGGDEAEEIVTTPTNVSYSPTINKVKDLKVDVPPDEKLEDLTYLGDNLKLYIDGELAFDGEIQEISTKQKSGEEYSLTAKPPGKKLKGTDLEKTVSNEIYSDRIAKIVDGYNEVGPTRDEFFGSDNETLTNAHSEGGETVSMQSGNDWGRATYNNLGDDISQVNAIYFKASSPEDKFFQVRVQTESDEYRLNYGSGLGNSRYGEWQRVWVSISAIESYSLEFYMEEDAILSDWLVIHDEPVERSVTEPEVNTIATDIPFYSRSGSELEDTEYIASEVGLSYDEEGRPQTRQISDWAINPFPHVGGDDFVNGLGGEIETGQTETRFQFSPEITFNSWSIFGRVKPYEIFVNRNETHTLGNTIYDRDWRDSAEPSTEQIAVEDSSVLITGDAEKRFQWTYDRNEFFDDLEISSQAYLTDTNRIDWIVEAGPFQNSDNEDGYAIRLSGGDIELLRLDAGSTTTLDTASYSRQQGEWIDWDITINSSGVSASLSDSNASYSLSSGDTTHNEFARFRVDTNGTHYLDDMMGEIGGNFRNVTLNLSLRGNELNDIGLLLPDNIGYREWGWMRIASQDFTSDFGTLTGDADFYVEASSRNEHAFIISPLVLVPYEDRWDAKEDFDLEVHEPEGHLDYPAKYATGDLFGNRIWFEPEISNTNISKSRVSSDVDTEDNIIGDWGPSQVIENVVDGELSKYPSSPNSTEALNEYAYAGVQHTVEYKLSSGGIRNNDSPRRGFKKQRLNSFSVTYDTNDLEILYDRNLSNNRLALMNRLAEDSTVLFRWEGNNVNIFHEGQEKTDVSLRSEDIESSVSIEDVYNSCEVVGLHNVRSGVLFSDEAPSYVDAHKTIRTEDIESEPDAINRARQFLSNHGSVKFKGKIDTLPTFAPLGASVDGDMFSHGQDMIIRNVRYGKRGTTISLGYEKDISTELISLEIQTEQTKSRASGRGMTIPVGDDQI